MCMKDQMRMSQRSWINCIIYVDFYLGHSQLSMTLERNSWKSVRICTGAKPFSEKIVPIAQEHSIALHRSIRDVKEPKGLQLYCSLNVPNLVPFKKVISLHFITLVLPKFFWISLLSPPLSHWFHFVYLWKTMHVQKGFGFPQFPHSVPTYF